MAPIQLQTPIGDRITAGYLYDYQQPAEAFEIYPGVEVPAGEYSENRFVWWLSASSARKLSGSLFGQVGGFYGGNLVQVTPGVVYRPSPHFALGLGYNGSFVDLPQASFDQHVGFVRFDLMFTVDLAWNTLVQYDHETGEIGIDSRLRWIIVPGREFYVVVKQELQERDGSVHLNRSAPLIKLRWTFRF